jgi:hypothetical protein
VRPNAVKVLRRGADWLVSDGATSWRVAESEAKLVSWVIARPAFSTEEFAGAFADRPSDARERFLADLSARRIIEAA